MSTMMLDALTDAEKHHDARTTFLMTIPRYIAYSTLIWVIHDYFLTLEDEVTYFWSQRPQFGILIFYWIRYYTIFLVLFNVIDHYIVHSGNMIIYSLVLGAVSLWSIEVVMQLRIYILFNRSRKVALFNGILFAISIAGFLWILISNAAAGKRVQHSGGELQHSTREVGPPPPDSVCPSLTKDSRWAQWVPATLFEFVLFGMAVYKTIVSSSAKVDINGRRSLTGTLLTENIIYFFVAACVLVFNNLLFVCQARIPWLGFGPFDAGLGLATGRLLIHLRKFAAQKLEAQAASRLDSRMTGMLPHLSMSNLDETS